MQFLERKVSEKLPDRFRTILDEREGVYEHYVRVFAYFCTVHFLF